MGVFVQASARARIPAQQDIRSVASAEIGIDRGISRPAGPSAGHRRLLQEIRQTGEAAPDVQTDKVDRGILAGISLAELE